MTSDSLAGDSSARSTSDLLDDVLRGAGATDGTLPELRVYCATPYGLPGGVPDLPLADEPHVAVWREYVEEASGIGAVAVLRARFPQFQFPIREGISQDPAYRAATRRGEAPATVGEGIAFEDPGSVWLEIHATPAGAVPVIGAGRRADFESLVRAFSERNEPAAVPDAMGACLIGGLNNWDRVARHRAQWAAGRDPASEAAEWVEEFRRLAADKPRYQDRVLILSSGPYSAVPAAEAGRGEREWLADSLRIRREHECLHYLTLRLFGLIRSNLLDELLADYAGLLAAYGEYRADLALRFLGIERDGSLRVDARLRVYRGSLSDAALAVVARLAVEAADELERRGMARSDRGGSAAAEDLVRWAGGGLQGLIAARL